MNKSKRKNQHGVYHESKRTTMGERLAIATIDEKVALATGRPCEKHNSERQDDSLQLQDMVTNNVSWAWDK